MERWHGRVAIITGASAGIGASLCTHLAELGMRVVAVARRLERLQELAAALGAACKGEIHPMQGDVTREEDVVRIISWTKQHLGGVHVLVNNAGVLHDSPLLSGTTAHWRHQLEVNVLGLSTFTREAIRDMRDRNCDDGHIIHINSVLGHHMYQFPNLAMYMASKHALTVLTECLRRELRDLGSHIRITSVSPGMVKTEIMAASGNSAEQEKEFYVSNPCLEPGHVAQAVEYVLAAPPIVNVEEVTLRVTCASD